MPLPGVPTIQNSHRGIMFALVDAANFQLIEYRSFDTWNSEHGTQVITPGETGRFTACPARGGEDSRYACSLAMAAFLQSLSASHAGHVVLVATYDEASRGLESTALAALRSVLEIRIDPAFRSIARRVVASRGARARVPLID